MSETIELRDYEQAETKIALEEARRGLVVHAWIALLSVVVHALLVLRARRSIERRQATIEQEVIEKRRAA